MCDVPASPPSRMSSRQLYNCICDESMMGDWTVLLDFRDTTAFAASHIDKAVQVSPDSVKACKDPPAALAWYTSLLKRYTELDSLTIVLITPDGREPVFSQLNPAAADPFERGLALMTLELHRHRKFMCKLYYLVGGYHAFKRAYPFFCTGSATLRDYPNLRREFSFPSHVTEHVFLGPVGSRATVVLDALDIRAVLCILEAEPSIEIRRSDGQHVEYMRLSAYDDPSLDLTSYIQGAKTFIENERMQGHRVLVHCQMGISRSATLVLGWLMLANHCKTLDQAEVVVGSARRIIDPNDGFFHTLQRLDKRTRYAPPPGARFYDPARAVRELPLSVDEEAAALEGKPAVATATATANSNLNASNSNLNASNSKSNPNSAAAAAPARADDAREKHEAPVEPAAAPQSEERYSYSYSYSNSNAAAADDRDSNSNSNSYAAAEWVEESTAAARAAAREAQWDAALAEAVAARQAQGAAARVARPAAADPQAAARAAAKARSAAARAAFRELKPPPWAPLPEPLARRGTWLNDCTPSGAFLVFSPPADGGTGACANAIQQPISVFL